MADGRFRDGLRSSQTSPRTPGPSDTRIRRNPIFSIGQVAQSRARSAEHLLVEGQLAEKFGQPGLRRFVEDGVIEELTEVIVLSLP